MNEVNAGSVSVSCVMLLSAVLGGRAAIRIGIARWHMRRRRQHDSYLSDCATQEPPRLQLINASLPAEASRRQSVSTTNLQLSPPTASGGSFDCYNFFSISTSSRFFDIAQTKFQPLQRTKQRRNNATRPSPCIDHIYPITSITTSPSYNTQLIITQLWPSPTPRNYLPHHHFLR